MSANDRQEGGSHYKNMSIQPWDALASWQTKEQFEGYLMGSAIAYLARVNSKGVPGKGGDGDVAKAMHFLEKWREVRRGSIAEPLKSGKYVTEAIEVPTANHECADSCARKSDDALADFIKRLESAPTMGAFLDILFGDK